MCINILERQNSIYKKILQVMESESLKVINKYNFLFHLNHVIKKVLKTIFYVSLVIAYRY